MLSKYSNIFLKPSNFGAKTNISEMTIKDRQIHEPVKKTQLINHIVEITKKGGRNVSNFLLYMNLDEISIKYLAIFIIYKAEKMCYNTICRGTHGPIRVSTNKRSITVTCLERNVNLMA